MNINLFLKPLLYLDPGSGSFIIQMLLAGLLGIAVAIRIYWKKIIGFFSRNKNKDVQQELDALDEYGSELENPGENDHDER